MMRRLIPISSLLWLFLIYSVGIARGDTPLSSTNVSYLVSDSVNYDGPIESIDFDVNVTLECETTYSYSVEGDLPGTATCHIGVAPHSGTLSVDYFIDRPLLSDLTGQKSGPLPQGGQELLGDSPPITIPIIIDTVPVGTITIVIHGYLLADLYVNSTSHASLEWSTWETKNIDITTNAPVTLSVTDSKYSVSFTVTVSIEMLYINFIQTDVVTREIPRREISGNPSEFIIPEFPSIFVLPLLMITTLTIVIVCCIRKSTGLPTFCSFIGKSASTRNKFSVCNDRM